MNIYDFAMGMEQDGEAFYRRLAEESPIDGHKAIFERLADAEVRHFRILKRMKDEGHFTIDETSVLDDAKSVFEEMAGKDIGELLDTQSTDMSVEAYRKAQEIEKESVDFYEDKAEELPDGALKDALLALAREEQRHWWILHNLVEHVGRPDHNWIEFAEWNHMEPY